MVQANVSHTGHDRSGPQALTSTQRRIPVYALGMSLAIFFMVSYTLCIASVVIFPDKALHQVWLQFLPWFEWLSWRSYLVGLVESFVYGWYIALVFGSLYNYFAARAER